jgi:hypothetical protein
VRPDEIVDHQAQREEPAERDGYRGEGPARHGARGDAERPGEHRVAELVQAAIFAAWTFGVQPP